MGSRRQVFSVRIMSARLQHFTKTTRNWNDPFFAILGAFRPQDDLAAFEGHIRPLEAEQLALAATGFQCRDDHRLKVRSGGLQQLVLLAGIQATVSLRLFPAPDDV
jgi:hypothetical protein